MTKTPPYRLILTRPHKQPDSIYHNTDHKTEAILTIMTDNGEEDKIVQHQITLKEAARHPREIEWQPNQIKTWLKHKIKPEEILEKYAGGSHLQSDKNGELYTKLRHLNNTDKCSKCSDKFHTKDKIYPIKTEEEIKPDYLCEHCKKKRKTAKKL